MRPSSSVSSAEGKRMIASLTCTRVISNRVTCRVVRTRLVSLLLVPVVGLLAACGSETPASASKKAALVIAQGGLGDESYNDLAMAGFTAATKETGIEGQPIESNDVVAQGEQVLRRAATSSYGLVIDLEFS